MRVALLSYEVPGQGGIGTYVRNAADMLSAERGHVEVYTQAATAAGWQACATHGVVCSDHGDFARAVVPAFAMRHRAEPFDVVEVPEYGAEGAGIAAAFPDLPMVVRLHTPSFVISEIWNSYLGPKERARFILGALRRGRWPEKPWSRPDTSGEREATLAAHLVVGPSKAILDLVGDRWGIPQEARMVVPNVFIPPPALLALDPARLRKTVLFIGRLEVRKGVLDLADAVQKVCTADPETRFIFLGRSLPMPFKSHDTKTELLSRIGRWRSNVTFIDSVPYEEIAGYFDKADIAVFPSIWENFPNVCLEAMSAGCGVVGSSAGGMAEIIEDGRTGLLVPPRNPAAIADCILSLLANPARRMAMGRAARAQVAAAYSPEVIAPLQIESYQRAIERARDGKRSGG